MKTVFVSSTFKDMHYERDAIREITAPLLNAEARKYGDELDFCDLRWGINTGELDTDEGSKKVLDVCLDEIDRCEPPMVVLLGYRYGWIPEADLIKTAAERKHLELDDLEKSVTALEIEYGALCGKEKWRNTLFYFREIEGDAPSDYLAEDKEHEEKISALKNRIKDITGGKLKSYTLKWNGSGFDGVNTFAEMLAEDIRAMIVPAWKEMENLTPWERERRTHWTFIREKNAMFRARQAEADKLVKDALSQPVTIIKGEVGSGKSTLFSHMATEFEKTDWTVLPFISGLTMENNSADDIIENSVYFIEEQLHFDHYIDEKDPRTGENKKHTPDEWRDKLAEMCSAYAKTGSKLLIMLDAADQLTPSEERDKQHFIPLSVSENIHFVMTCTMDFKTPGREYYALRQLDDEDKQEVIGGILTRCRKEISGSVINEMLKLQSSNNPLYLSLLVQRLLMMNSADFTDIRSKGDGMSAIEQHQLELIKNKCPDDLGEMSAALLNEAGKRINEKLVSKSAEYLAISRNGLRRKDLSALLGVEWAEVDFSHFVSYMNDCFLLRDDGRYDFTHKSIRTGFRSQCRDLDRVNSEIFEYFKELEADDAVRIREIVYHAIQADKKRFFVEYIIVHKGYGNKSHINYAARDAYAQCITDSGKWMIDVLKEAEKYEADDKLRNLSIFYNEDLNMAFFGSQKELEIKLQVLSANILFSEHLSNRLSTNECKNTLSLSCERVARIHTELGSRENQKRALELYAKVVEIREQLAKELSTWKTKSDLSISYEELGEIYEAFGSRENLKRALEQYHLGLKISEQLAKAPGTVDNKRNLSISYGRAARIYEKLGGRENLEQALELYEKCLEIRERLVEETGTADSKSDLAIGYNSVAGIYERLGGRKNLEQALELYAKGLEIREWLTKETGTAYSKRGLSVSYDRVAGIYEKLDGWENIEHALELYDKAFEIRERLAKELGTADSKRNLSISYENLARISEKLGDREDLERALEWYAKGLEIKKQLEKESGTAYSKRGLSISYNNVAAVYEKLGGRENLERALELHKKALAISEELANILKTVDAYDDLFISLCNIAIHPSTAISDRKILFNRGLNISKMLYEQTKMDKYKTNIDVLTKTLNQYT